MKVLFCLIVSACARSRACSCVCFLTLPNKSLFLKQIYFRAQSQRPLSALFGVAAVSYPPPPPPLGGCLGNCSAAAAPCRAALHVWISSCRTSALRFAGSPNAPASSCLCSGGRASPPAPQRGLSAPRRAASPDEVALQLFSAISLSVVELKPPQGALPALLRLIMHLCSCVMRES